MEEIEKCLHKLIYSPYIDTINFDLAYSYEQIKQYAAAVSFYLRCAEFTSDNTIASEALLRASLCISRQSGRDLKELHLIKHSISVSPNSIEAYYIASLYYSWRGNWLDSYMYSCNGINVLESNNHTKKFLKPLDFNYYDLYYQKAYSGSKIGKIDEARNIYINILNSFKLSDNTINFIKNRLLSLPQPNHDPLIYTNDNHSLLKYKFNNYKLINRNYSQIYQDMYILSMLNGKKNGTYLEIGAGDYKYGNNTYLLEKVFNWRGVSIDIDKTYVDNFNINRKNTCMCIDATSIDYNNFLK